MANRLIVAVFLSMLLSSTGTAKKIIIGCHKAPDANIISKLEKLGFEVRHAYGLIPAIAGEVDDFVLSELEKLDFVKQIFEDKLVFISLEQSGPQIHAPGVHLQGMNGFNVSVCIVDTGIDDSHPALPALIHQINMLNQSAPAFDDHGHGTHVAGIVASRDPTYLGIAPGANLMAAKVLNGTGYGLSSDVIAGIEWCVVNNASVINLSLGSDAYVSNCDLDPVAIAGNLAADAGVFVVAASGNDGYGNAISSPACGSQVIAVGAVSKSDERTAFSNEGALLDVVAPGVGIISTFPGGLFTGMSGTSMASPHVAGVAALLLQNNSELSPQDVADALFASAKDLGVGGFDTVFGNGRVDALGAYHELYGDGGDGGGGDGGGGDGSEVNAGNLAKGNLCFAIAVTLAIVTIF